MPDRRPDAEIEFNDEIERLGKERDEARRALNELTRERDQARAAIERVRELPCSVCLAGRYCHRYSVPYPCATARALDTADQERSDDGAAT